MLKKLIPVILIIPLMLSSCNTNVFNFLNSGTQSPDSTYEYTVPTASDDSTENTISNYGFYYNQLSDYEKNIYEAMFESAANYESVTYFSGADYDSFYAAACAISYDQPQFFWINGNFSMMTANDYVTQVTFNVPDDAGNIIQEIESVSDEILSGITEDMSDYDKLKYIYDWIINNVDYSTGDHDQDIRSVFLEHKSVCAGYSRAFEYLCDRLKIPCTFISGQINDGGSHAWNLVYLTGNYYWVDVTWGDPIYYSDNGSGKEIVDPVYDYFLVSDNDMFISHVLKNNIEIGDYSSEENFFSYPECYNDNYNYHMMHGSYFYEYDQNVIDSYILNKLYTEEDIIPIDFKFSTADAWEQAYYDIIPSENNSHVSDLIKDYYNSQALFNFISYSLSYTYSKNSLSFRLEIRKT